MEANLVLLKVSVQHGDGIAIGNPDDAAHKGRGLRRRCNEKKNDSKKREAHDA
jgi:hypothetical protein